MRKSAILITICAAAIFLAQCAKKGTPSASMSPAEEVAQMKKKYTPEQIASGKAILEGKCGECHELHQPNEYTVKSWDKILPKMSRKANLNAADAGILRAWVLTNAKQG